MGKITIKTLFKKDSILVLLKIFIPGFLFFGLMALYSFLNDFHFNDLTEDPIQTMHAPPYIGLIARADVVLMCFAAAILLFAARISGFLKKSKEQTGFLLFSGLLSLWLMCDDFFMFHDWVFRDIIPVNENIIFLVYGLSAIALLYFYRNLILKTDYILLLLGMGLMGASELIDAAIAKEWFSWTYQAVLEDGAKFFGMVFWMAYYIITASDFLKPAKE